ncbi:MAG: hypothetical protein O7A69_01755 [SAR324 cluster bacterium]|nr:hypothetical protein [SAR324 cluster bacterium]
MAHKREDFLQGVLETGQQPSSQYQNCKALVAAAEANPPVLSSLEAFSTLISPNTEEPLAEYFRFALLGVGVGFAERNLSPRDEKHLEIIPPLLEEIRAVYDHLTAAEAPYDPDEFRFKAYDYGIHKAYYLDWRLYLSKELY